MSASGNDGGPRKPNAGPLAAFFAGHLLSYPVAFVFAVFGIVPALRAIPPNELANGEPRAVVVRVLGRLVWPSLAVFVVAHAAALPWMREGGGAGRGMKISLALYFGMLAVGGALAAFVWAKLFFFE